MTTTTAPVIYIKRIQLFYNPSDAQKAEVRVQQDIMVNALVAFLGLTDLEVTYWPETMEFKSKHFQKPLIRAQQTKSGYRFQAANADYGTRNRGWFSLRFETTTPATTFVENFREMWEQGIKNLELKNVYETKRKATATAFEGFVVPELEVAFSSYSTIKTKTVTPRVRVESDSIFITYSDNSDGSGAFLNITLRKDKAPVLNIQPDNILFGNSTAEQLLAALPKLQEFTLHVQALTKTLDEDAQKRF